MKVNILHEDEEINAKCEAIAQNHAAIVVQKQFRHPHKHKHLTATPAAVEANTIFDGDAVVQDHAGAVVIVEGDAVSAGHKHHHGVSF